MRRTVSVLALLAVMGAAVPSSTLAGSRGGAGHVRGSSRAAVHKGFSVEQKSVFPQPVDPWKSWGVSPRHRHSFTPFVGTPGFVGGTSMILTQPPLTEMIDPFPVVYASPLIAAPAAPMAVPASATLPMASLVEYPSGWYQLRGDGVMTPYQWIWIPKPPAQPMPSLQPAAQAMPSVQGAARLAESEVRDKRGPAYRWTDDSGVTTWTNRLERVPKRFRDQAAARVRSD